LIARDTSLRTQTIHYPPSGGSLGNFAYKLIRLRSRAGMISPCGPSVSPAEVSEKPKAQHLLRGIQRTPESVYMVMRVFG